MAGGEFHNRVFYSRSSFKSDEENLNESSNEPSESSYPTKDFISCKLFTYFYNVAWILWCMGLLVNIFCKYVIQNAIIINYRIYCKYGYKCGLRVFEKNKLPKNEDNTN